MQALFTNYLEKSKKALLLNSFLNFLIGKQLKETNTFQHGTRIPYFRVNSPELRYRRSLYIVEKGSSCMGSLLFEVNDCNDSIPGKAMDLNNLWSNSLSIWYPHPMTLAWFFSIRENGYDWIWGLLSLWNLIPIIISEP